MIPTIHFMQRALKNLVELKIGNKSHKTGRQIGNVDTNEYKALQGNLSESIQILTGKQN